MISAFRRLRLSWTLTRRLGALIQRANRRPSKTVIGWIETDYGKFYMRVGGYTWITNNDGRIRPITLASVEIVERYQRRGFFKVALKAIEETARMRCFGVVVVENVHNDELHPYLLRCGYLPKPYDPVTFFKVLK